MNLMLKVQFWRELIVTWALPAPVKNEHRTSSIKYIFCLFDMIHRLYYSKLIYSFLSKSACFFAPICLTLKGIEALLGAKIW